MDYLINKANGDFLVRVSEGTIDSTTTSLGLVGKNFSGYGETLNENFLHLLESWAGVNPPNAPLRGQLWFDSDTRILKVYDGIEFNPAGSGIRLDQQSNTLHYHAFVEQESGAPPFKTSKEKGLSIHPLSGNMGINKANPSGSKLEINGGTTAIRVLAPPLAITYEKGETVLHLHGDDDKSSRMLVDSYGNPSMTEIGFGSTVNLRRSRKINNNLTALQFNDTIGGILAHGHDGQSYSRFNAGIMFRAGQNWDGNTHNCNIEFWTTPPDSLLPLKKAELMGNGDFRALGDIVAYTSSDIRLKTNLQKLQNALLNVTRLDGLTFNYNNYAIGKDPYTKQVGIIAQQVKEVLPEAVETRDDGYLAVDYAKIVPLLIEAIKELKIQVDELKAKIT
jgi:hypothetical protein